jgi:hypothetical protein
MLCYRQKILSDQTTTLPYRNHGNVKLSIDESACEKPVEDTYVSESNKHARNDLSQHHSTRLVANSVGLVVIICVLGFLIWRWTTTLELWWLSLSLMLGSIGFALEVNARFDDKVEKIKQDRLDVGRQKIREVLKTKSERDITVVENRIFSMEDYRVKADEPVRLLNTTVQYYFFSFFFFLGALVVRAGIDYQQLPATLWTWESGGFVLGLIIFVLAVIDTYSLIRLRE